VFKKYFSEPLILQDGKTAEISGPLILQAGKTAKISNPLILKKKLPSSAFSVVCTLCTATCCPANTDITQQEQGTCLNNFL
jgi:hypothetical protein